MSPKRSRPVGSELARSLRAVARRVRERTEQLDPDQLAWLMLHRDGEVHPWSAAAEEAFGGIAPYTGTDDRVRHHRALCLHARAFDLQRAGEAARALPYWRAALRDWAALHASDAFWGRLAERMPSIDGRRVPREVLDAARRALPGQLLDVQVSLVRALRRAEPELAAEHAALIRHSGFPPEAVAAARAALVAGLDAPVAQAIEQRRVGPMFDEVVTWLRIDPAAPGPAHLLVALASAWAWRLWQQDDGWTAVGNMLGRVEEVLPLDDEAAAALSDGDTARLHYWRGVHLRYSTALPRIGTGASDLGVIRRANERAERHLREAMARSPDVRLHPWLIHRQLAEPLSVQALCARLAGRDDDARRLAAAAVALDPECTRAVDLLDQLAEPDAQPVSIDVDENPVDEAVLVDVGTVDRCIARGELVQALDVFEVMARVSTGTAARRELAEHPVVSRLGVAVQHHPVRRRRFHEALARLGGSGERRDAG